MPRHFPIPEPLLSAWILFAARYRDYLPDVDMHSDSFAANPIDAEAIFQELEELARADPKAFCAST